MKTHKVTRYRQTSDFNCGPTALAQLLSFYGDDKNPAAIEKNLDMIKDIGIDGSCLGTEAINYGYKARIIPQNLYIFDPQWFNLTGTALIGKLRDFSAKAKGDLLKISINNYIKFLEKGGKLTFQPLSKEFLADKIKKYPVLIGFCITYLYNENRPNNPELGYRDTHFVVVNGYDPKSDSFSIVDPYHSIRFSKSGRYQVKSDRLIEAMFLAEATYDCTILEIWK